MTLLVVAAVRDALSAIAYLLVFGLGTMVGMMVITMSIASALRFVGARSEIASRRLGLTAGVASIIFGVIFAYGVWSTAAPSGH